MGPRDGEQAACSGVGDETKARGEITRVLRQLEAGVPDAEERLLALVYDRLRRIARGYLGRERPGHELSASDLVHEAYLRLFGDEPPPMKDRGHLYAAFARATRRVLVDHARARASAKHGGDLQRVTLSVGWDVPAPGGSATIDILALDQALDRLHRRSDRHARIVELRCFAGLTVPEVAEALAIGTTTVDQDWAAAKAWLLAELGG